MPNSNITFSEIMNFCSRWEEEFKIYYSVKFNRFVDIETRIFLFWNVRNYCIKEKKQYDTNHDAEFRVYLYSLITKVCPDFGNEERLDVLLTTRYNMYSQEMKGINRKDNNYIPLNLYRAIFVDTFKFVCPSLLCDYTIEEQRNIRTFAERIKSFSSALHRNIQNQFDDR